MKVKKLNEFYQMSRHIQDSKAYMPQTEMELVNIVHGLFHDYFNGTARFTKDVMRDIMFDLSGIEDASPATQMIVHKNQITFEDIEYLYFLGITLNEWEQNKNVFRKDDSELYIDPSCCEFGIYTKAECYNISVSVLLDWKYEVDEDNVPEVIIIRKMPLNDVRYGRNKPVRAEEFKHFPCYEALERYINDLMIEFNYNDNIMSELYRAAEKDAVRKSAMIADDTHDAIRDTELGENL